MTILWNVQNEPGNIWWGRLKVMPTGADSPPWPEAQEAQGGQEVASRETLSYPDCPVS